MTTARMQKIFYRGNHREVVDLTIDGKKGQVIVGEAPFVIGALSFLGRLDEAQFLYKKFLTDLDFEALSAARFYLAIGLCRHSDYSQAAKLFAENLRLARKKKNPLIKFFANQGVGFYRYFCGRYANAHQSAKRALLEALGAGFLYGKFLASDLIGHGLVQTGNISEGLAHLSNAMKFAKLLGNGSMAEATEISIACYEAQFGLLINRAIPKLQDLYKKLSPQNSYSRASLLLELARQCSLTGNVNLSGQYLDEACRIIYEMKHRRQTVFLNLRYAYNYYLSGEAFQALNLLRVTKNEIHPSVDIAIELQLIGFQFKLAKELRLESELDALQRRMVFLTNRIGGGIALRMLQRNGLGRASPFPRGQDLLGDLLDSNDTDQKLLQDIFTSGYLSVLRRTLKISAKSRHIYVGIAPNDLIVIVEGGNISTSEDSLPLKLHKLVRQLSRGEQTKEQLVENVWGYKYSPLRHDPLIYSTVSRLRDFLGEYSHWLEATERGYRLAKDVKLIDADINNATDAKAGLKSVSMVEDRSLNYRQLQIMRHLRRSGVLDVRDCIKLFQISRVTAARDLAELCKGGMLMRHGKGRATKYTLAGTIH